MSKILIVEDDRIIIKILKKWLVDNNFEVVYAEDAYRGIEFARKEKPDLIILDMLMPLGGGLAVLKSVKSSCITKDIPIIVHSASVDEDFKKKVIEKGADVFLQKPCDSQILITTINGLIH